jgi:hypothetical protein
VSAPAGVWGAVAKTSANFNRGRCCPLSSLATRPDISSTRDSVLTLSCCNISRALPSPVWSVNNGMIQHHRQPVLVGIIERSQIPGAGALNDFRSWMLHTYFAFQNTVLITATTLPFVR